MKEETIRDLVRISAMSPQDLAEEYKERTGAKNAYGAMFMRRRLSQLAQEDREGGLTETERQILSKVFERTAPITGSNPRPPKLDPVRGTVYSRLYKGRLIEVRYAGHNQYEYNGATFKSLTACVKEITGQHFSGKKFFKVGG